MKTICFALSVTIFLLISSCNEGTPGKVRSLEYKNELANSQGNAEVKNQIPTDRKIIREGSINFQTKSISNTRTLLTKTAEEMGGYISNETSNSFENRTEQTVTIRVPSDKFDLLISRISESAEKIESKNISSQDVTEEYIDVEARIKTKKELENRYLELLHKASSVSDIMAIEKEAGTLREEIESVEGRLRYLKDRVSLSSLTVTYYQTTSSDFGFAPKTGTALKNGWKGLLWLIIGLFSIWPFILIIAGGIFGGLWYNKKRKNR